MNQGVSFKGIVPLQIYAKVRDNKYLPVKHQQNINKCQSMIVSALNNPNSSPQTKEISSLYACVDKDYASKPIVQCVSDESKSAEMSTLIGKKSSHFIYLVSGPQFDIVDGINKSFIKKQREIIAKTGTVDDFRLRQEKAKNNKKLLDYIKTTKRDMELNGKSMLMKAYFLPVYTRVGKLKNFELESISFVPENLEPIQASKKERIEGCLFGGAIGDALGAKIEWYEMDQIKQKYGEKGLRYIPKTNGVYKITDDTQMTLFTCEGLLKSFSKLPDVNVEPDYMEMYNSYKNWYLTQTTSFQERSENTMLMGDETLYSRRFPGLTCLDTLKKGIPGTVENPVNDSMANGGVMRVAPVGLMYCHNPELAFSVGVKSTALTHGHPNAYLPAGFLASLIANLVNGASMSDAISKSIEILDKYENNESTKECIKKAMEFAASDIPVQEAIENIGYGGRGDEALGISLYSVLKYPQNFKKALAIAANHPGDSDSTAAIAGNILGAFIGTSNLPPVWKEKIEHSNTLSIMSNAIEYASEQIN